MESSSTRVRLLGVPVDALTANDAVGHVQSLLQSEQQSHVMTPNSEMLVEAVSNESFRSLLNRTALNVPDSVGLVKMAKRTGQSLPERVAGVDLVVDLCRSLSAEHSVFLLGGSPGIAERAADVLQKHNSQLTIAGTYAGSPDAQDASRIIQQINASGTHLLLVAYGAPQQDLWIDQHLSSMPNVHVAMGVGGTFDFLAGKAIRAPLLFRRLGLEWLWRLIQQPSRIKRIWNAVVVFPLLVKKHGREL